MKERSSTMKILRTRVSVLAVLFLMVGMCYAQSAEEYLNRGIEYRKEGKHVKNIMGSCPKRKN